MSCETYLDALKSAAAGAVMTSALRSHLAACAACRTTLAEEQSLLAYIDSGLRIVANSPDVEVPPSLIPSVRARLQERVPQGRWIVRALIPAAAALLLALLVVPGLRRPGGKPSDSGPTASVTSSTPAAQFPRLHGPAPVVPAPATKSGVALASRRSSLPARPRPGSNAEAAPEVLVPPDQEVLLARYVEQLRNHKHVRLTAELRDAPLEPLELIPIQIDPLDVKSMADGSR